MADASDKIAKGAQVTYIGSGTSLAAGAIMPSLTYPWRARHRQILTAIRAVTWRSWIAPTASIASTRRPTCTCTGAT